MTDFMRSFFDAGDATGDQPVASPRTRVLGSEARRTASWESPSSSLEDLQLEALPDPETPTDTAHEHRNEVLYLLKVERRPDVRRSLAARLALEERALDDAFRRAVLEPAAEVRRAVEREADDLLQFVRSLSSRP